MTTDKSIKVEKLKVAFNKVKQELDEHLGAINENTNEIRENYDYVCELNARVDKLAEKIDEISFFLQELKSQKDLIVSLSPHEQKVFLALYLEHSPLPFFEIVKRTQLPAAMVERILNTLIEKNIPIVVQQDADIENYIMDSKFKERQARENIVQIDETITKSMFVKDLNNFM